MVVQVAMDLDPSEPTGPGHRGTMVVEGTGYARSLAVQVAMNPWYLGCHGPRVSRCPVIEGMKEPCRLGTLAPGRLDINGAGDLGIDGPRFQATWKPWFLGTD